MIIWLLVAIFLVITYLLAKEDLLWAIGWMIFMAPSYIVRLNFFGIPTNALELGVYVVFLVWIIRIIRGKSIFRWRKFYWLPLILLFVALISIILVADDRKMSLGLWKGWIFDPILIFLIVSCEFRKLAQISWIKSGFLFLVGMLGTIGIWQWLTGNIDTVDGRLAVFFTSANYLAMLLASGLSFLLAGFLMEKKRKWWEIFFLVLGLWALIASGSFISVFALVLTVGWMVLAGWQKKGNVILWVIFGCVLVAAIFFGTQIGSERMSNMLDLSKRSSVTVRMQVWQTAWAMVADNPVVGIGLGNFEKKYIEYLPSVVANPLEWRMLHAHNFWLQTWLTMSIFGLLVFLMIVIYSWWLGMRMIKRLEKQFWVVYGLMGYLLSFVLVGLLDTPYYKNDFSLIFWIMIGLLIALTKILQKEKRYLKKMGKKI
ncbi:MAG: O-antigen ligase family protein [Patescibacteria group bacterium]